MKALANGKQFKILSLAGWTACLAVLALCSGCIVFYIPTNYHDADSRRNIARPALSSVFPGQTTREQVLLTFGEPDSQDGDDRQMIYQWTKVKGYWLFALVWAKAGSAGLDKKGYRLVITFDEEGLVVNREIREWDM